MPVDPGNSDTFEEAETGVDGDRGGDTYRSPETPEADAAEQRTALVDEQDSQPSSETLEANPADVAEQARVVKTDEDDYR